jgi:RNA polymerase sigma-70 factor, ECF subfamily
MERASSQRLLNQARAGDQAAFGRLLQQLRPYVRVLARGAHRGALAGRADDSDLVQDAMVEVTRSFHGFRGAEVPEFLAWLRQVVAHTVHNSVRQFVGTRKRNPAAVDASLDPALVAGPGDGPDRLAELREDSARAAAAVERLPADLQQVLLLRLVDDLPHAEIAGRTGRTEAACRMAFLRAVRRLQELLVD